MEENNDVEKVKVFTSEDDKLKILGELLSNESSRNIIKLLTEREVYANEIARKLELRLNLVIHHLKKLDELGLLEITEKEITKKGSKHKYYKMIPNLLVSPNRTKQNLDAKGVLRRILSPHVKILSVCATFCSTWLVSKIIHLESTPTLSNSGESSSYGNETFIPIIIAMTITLAVIVITKKCQKRPRKS